MNTKSKADDEPSSSLGLYFRIFTHFTSRVTLPIIVSSSQSLQCTAKAILLITACHLSCLLYFTYSLVFAFHHTFPHVTQDITWSNMPHTLSAHLSSSQLYLLVTFSHFHLYSLFSIIASYSFSFQLFGSFHVQFSRPWLMISQLRSISWLCQVGYQCPHGIISQALVQRLLHYSISHSVTAFPSSAQVHLTPLHFDYYLACFTCLLLLFLLFSFCF